MFHKLNHELYYIVIFISIFLICINATSISKISNIKSILKSAPIKAIFCDIDGTLTYDKDHKISDRTFDSINALREKSILFLPATGRTRFAMNQVTRGKVSNLFGGEESTPGVYQQGLSCYDLKGISFHQALLDPFIIEYVESFCKNHNLDVIAYCGSDIYTTRITTHTDLVVEYEDAPPQISSQIALSNQQHIQKLIILNRDHQKMESIKFILKKDEFILDNKAVITQAVPEMVEVLPPGGSKGNGVKKMLDKLNIDASECICFGDGENDLEMFELIDRGFAVENAKPLLKNAASAVIKKNSEHAVSEVIEKILEQ